MQTCSSYAGLAPTRASQLMHRLLAASFSSVLSLASAFLSSLAAIDLLCHPAPSTAD